MEYITIKAYMKYRESTSKELNTKQIDTLRKSVGWQNKRSDEKWKEILSKSFFVYSVWDKDKLIGMGRILEDGIVCIFYDVVVHKDYQGKGIGGMIVEKLLDQVKDKDYASVSLFMDPKNVKFLKPFYEKYGFESVKTAMRCKKITKKSLPISN